MQEAFLGLLGGRFAFDSLRGSLQNFLFGVVRLLILKHEEPRRCESPLPEPDADDPELPAEDACPLAQVCAPSAAATRRR